MAENRFTDPSARYFTGMSTEPIPPPPPGTGFALEATLQLIRIKTDNIPPLGQALMNASVPVVIAANQSPLPISGTITAIIPNPMPVSQSGAWLLGSNSGTDIGDVTINNAAGAGAVNIQDGGNSITVDGVVSAIQSGAWTVTANAGTNLNTSLLLLDSTFTGRINTLGQKVMAASTPVVLASDQSAIPITGTVTATIPNPLPVSQSGAWTVAATQSGSWVLSPNPGVDIGDVTIDNGAGAAAVNIQDGGNSITVDGTIAATQSGVWTVAATQSGSWILTANSGVDIGDVTINNAAGAAAVNIQDGGNSITVDGTIAATQSGIWSTRTLDGSGTAITSTANALDVNIKSGVTLTVALDFSSDTVTVYGSQGVPLQQKVTTNDLIVTLDGETVAATQSGTWILGANSGIDIGDVTINNAAGAAAVNIQDGGNSITVDGTIAATQSGVWTVAATQSGTWNITNISGVISLPTGAATAALQTQPGVDIGDVTINNAAGAAAVNIQDGGNSITVDGTIAATQSGAWTVTANAGTDLNTSLLLLDTTFTGRINTQGQKTMAASTPVVLASDQSTITISGTVTANAGTNLNTSALATQSTLSSLNSLVTGWGSSGTSAPLVKLGSVSNPAAVTNTTPSSFAYGLVVRPVGSVNVTPGQEQSAAGRTVCPLASTGYQLLPGVPGTSFDIRAASTNVGNVVVGPQTTIDATPGLELGIPLEPGDFISIRGPTGQGSMWVKAANAGDQVHWVIYV